MLRTENGKQQIGNNAFGHPNLHFSSQLLAFLLVISHFDLYNKIIAQKIQIIPRKFKYLNYTFQYIPTFFFLSGTDPKTCAT